MSAVMDDSMPDDDRFDGADSGPPASFPRAALHWDEPISFDAPSLPHFPTHALPDRLQRFVEEEAEATQTPADLAGVLVLGACAGAVARKVSVRVKQGYVEPTNLMITVAMPPGTRKSAVFRDVFRPIEEEERELAELAKPKIAEAAAARAVAEERVKAARKELAQSGDDAGRGVVEKRLQEALIDLAAMSVPCSPRLLGDDMTPEAIAAVMADHGERLTIASPEGGIFDIIGGRYSNGPNMEILLKAHAGDSVRVDRKNLDSKPISLARPALTMALAVQPAVIRSLASKPDFHGRGLLARFLFVLPVSRVGERNVDAEPLSDVSRSHYHIAVRALLALPFRDDGEATILDLEPAAYSAWRDLSAELEPRLRADVGDLAPVAEWASKLAGAVARIAGVLHCAGLALSGKPLETPISADTMTSAIAIGRYLCPHALAAFGIMRAVDGDDDARALLRWLRRPSRASSRFSPRDVQRALGKRFRSAEQVGRAIRVLEERAYVRPAHATSSGGPGRPSSPDFDVHPFIGADSADSADRKGKPS